MRLLVASEQRFLQGPSQQLYAEGPARYAMWANYLEEFEEVKILARVGAEAKACAEEARADGPSVSFLALPDYRGPWGYVANRSELKKRVRQAVDECDAYMLRVPGLVGGLVWRELRTRGKPFALEVVGDPWDAFGPGTWPGIFRPAFREIATRELKAMCLEASALHYVTRSSLQQRYPAGDNAYTVGFSDALMDAAFATREKLEERFRRIDTIGRLIGGDGIAATSQPNRESGPPSSGQGLSAEASRPCRIGFVGSLSQMYKGPDVLLRAMAECRRRGLNVEAALLGEGRCIEAMKSLAATLGIAASTQFLGQLPAGKPVFAFLDSVDVFAMPSRSEGLPRALLEAMARGCPCIGSAVGGIPELLPAEDMVPVGDARALADKIMEVAANAARMKQMATRNVEKAKEFSPELLRDLRRGFCRVVRERAGEAGVVERFTV